MPFRFSSYVYGIFRKGSYVYGMHSNYVATFTEYSDRVATFTEWHSNLVATFTEYSVTWTSAIGIITIKFKNTLPIPQSTAPKWAATVTPLNPPTPLTQHFLKSARGYLLHGPLHLSPMSSEIQTLRKRSNNLLIRRLTSTTPKLTKTS